jgi:hypothetical protein
VIDFLFSKSDQRVLKTPSMATRSRKETFPHGQILKSEEEIETANFLDYNYEADQRGQPETSDQRSDQRAGRGQRGGKKQEHLVSKLYST